jgi:hypothetical protein
MWAVIRNPTTPGAKWKPKIEPFIELNPSAVTFVKYDGEKLIELCEEVYEFAQNCALADESKDALECVLSDIRKGTIQDLLNDIRRHLTFYQ